MSRLVRSLVAGVVALACVLASGCGGQRMERTEEQAVSMYRPMLLELGAAVVGADPAASFGDVRQGTFRDRQGCWHELSLWSTTGGGEAVLAAEKDAVNAVWADHGFPRDQEWSTSQGIAELTSRDDPGAVAIVQGGRRVQVVVRVPAPATYCRS